MSDVKKTELKQYTGESVEVAWDKALCIHVAECGRAAGDLFEMGRKPWCSPDVTHVDDVAEVVERCPTGALSYRRLDDGAEESASEVNRVFVSNHGPLYVRGDLEIAATPENSPGLRYRAALCRCGQSKNKPYCDNAHEGAGFRDRGAVGERGDGDAGEPGALTIRRAANGPLLLRGPVEIWSAGGCRTFVGSKAALCRCGQSKNKPFCDGAHRDAGFEAEGD